MTVAYSEAVLLGYDGYGHPGVYGGYGSYGGYAGYGPAISHAGFVSPVVSKIAYGVNPHGYGAYGSYGAYGNDFYGHGLSSHDSYVSVLVISQLFVTNPDWS